MHTKMFKDTKALEIKPSDLKVLPWIQKYLGINEKAEFIELVKMV